MVVVFPYMLNSAVFNFTGKSQILRFIYHKLDMVEYSKHPKRRKGIYVDLENTEIKLVVNKPPNLTFPRKIKNR